jgi:hypothetical protein
VLSPYTDTDIWTHLCADGTPGALLLFQYCGRSVAFLVEIPAYHNNLLGTYGDTDLTSLTSFLINFNFSHSPLSLREKYTLSPYSLRSFATQSRRIYQVNGNQHNHCYYYIVMMRLMGVKERAICIAENGLVMTVSETFQGRAFSRDTHDTGAVYPMIPS